jgi:hypothetical protein
MREFIQPSTGCFVVGTDKQLFKGLTSLFAADDRDDEIGM